MPNIPTGSTSQPFFSFILRLCLFGRQTVFYTPDTLTVSAGDQITGEISCAPNARNNRDLDIVLSYKVSSDPNAASTIQYKMCVFRFILTATDVTRVGCLGVR